MKKQYFIRVAKTYSTKNKLDKAILKALSVHDSTLLKSSLDIFYDNVRSEVMRLNTQHPRCSTKDLKASKNENTLTLYVDDVIFIDIYLVKQTV